MSEGVTDLNAAFESRNLRVDESGVLRRNDAQFPCALGRDGIRRDKIKGDGAMPLGEFPLRRVLYRPDRLAPLSPRDGWCNDSEHPLYKHKVSGSIPEVNTNFFNDLTGNG